MYSWFADSRDISSYLAYRYIPEKLSLGEHVVRAAERDPIEGSLDELAVQGANALRKTIASLAAEYNTDTTHVVTLSGGLDSRNILAALLHTVPKERIVTVTYGIPGSYDYEIAPKVAAAAGVKHEAIDITPGRFPWTHKRMLKSAQTFHRPTKLFRAFTALDEGLSQRGLNKGCVYWTGYFGDAISGDHLPEQESITWEQAIDTFVENNLTYPQLAEPGYEPQECLPDEPAMDREAMSFDDQLDLGVRQPYFIAPSICLLEPDVSPFNTDPFLSFMLNVPREYRTGRELYLKIGRVLSPELYDVPTQQGRGLGVDVPKWRKAPHILRVKATDRALATLGKERPSKTSTYLDWDVELRRSKQLQELVEPALVSLSDRGAVPWLSPIDFYRKHRTGANYGGEIHMLTSLELFLQL